MSNICELCGQVVPGADKRRRYCSPKCANRARLNRESRKRRETRTADRLEWAMAEAGKIIRWSRWCGSKDLAEYIYNNFKRK